MKSNFLLPVTTKKFFQVVNIYGLLNPQQTQISYLNVSNASKTGSKGYQLFYLSRPLSLLVYFDMELICSIDRSQFSTVHGLN